MAGERGGRPGRGVPFVGTVLAIQTAAPGQVFALAGFEATAVIQVARADYAEGRTAVQVAIILYGGSLARVRTEATVTVYAIRAGSYNHRDGGGPQETWAVYYAHYLDHGGDRRR